MSFLLPGITPPRKPASVAVRAQLWLSDLVDGIVTDDPRAKARVIALIYLILAPLSALGAALYQSDDWVSFAVGRLVVLGGFGAFVWRRPRLRDWEPVVYLGALPAALFVNATLQSGTPIELRIVFPFLVPTLAGIMYSRRVAAAASAFELAALVWFSVRYFSPGHAIANIIGFAVVFGVTLIAVNGTSVRLRNTLAELRHAQAERDRIQLAMDHATEHERARIATELHDDTIQVMTAASLKLDVAKSRRGGTDGPSDLNDALDLMQQAISRARRLSFDLYPPSLDDGLAPALHEIAARLRADGGAAVSVAAGADRYPPEVERLVYRTAKELLENARKHARATTIVATVRSAGEGVALEVVDDGIGFEPAQAPTADGEFHFGLRAADERIRRAGGSLVVDSVPGRGTRVLVWVPLHQSAANPRRRAEDRQGSLLRSERPMEPPA